MSRTKTGFTKLVTKAKPKKKVIIPVSASPEIKRATGGWLGVSLEDKYQDRRPVWRAARPIEQGWTPNSMGEECDRVSILQVLGYQNRISSQLRRIFDMGNDIEARWVERFKAMGVYQSSQDIVKRSEPPIISGKLDVIVRHPYEGSEIIVEIKSINTNGFKSLPAVTLDPEYNFESLCNLKGKMGPRIRGYMVQLQSYLHDNTRGVRNGMLLFDCKNDSNFADYFVVHNEEFIREQYDRLIRLNYYRESMTVPPCTCGGKGDFCKVKKDEEIDLETIQSMTEVLI